MICLTLKVLWFVLNSLRATGTRSSNSFPKWHQLAVPGFCAWVRKWDGHKGIYDSSYLVCTDPKSYSTNGKINMPEFAHTFCALRYSNVFYRHYIILFVCLRGGSPRNDSFVIIYLLYLFITKIAEEHAIFPNSVFFSKKVNILGAGAAELFLSNMFFILFYSQFSSLFH